MALSLKSNVRFGSSEIAMCIANQIVMEIFREVGADCTITSANDSTHSTNSLHYKDRALDYRSHHLTAAEKDDVLAKMKERLNAPAVFDVLLESRGTPNEHYHIEFDQK